MNFFGNEELRPFGKSVAFMLSILGTMETRSFGELMASLGLEPRSFGVLRALADIGPVTQHQLSTAAHVPTSTLVALLDDLEARDLISRHPHPEDRRAHQVSLTDKGRLVIEEATALAWSHEEAITEQLTPLERRALLDALSKIYAKLSGEH
jgi:DNA-binding MarR family transcriptional regulator